MANSAITAIRREREALLAQIQSLQGQLAGLDRALAILDGPGAPAAAARPSAAPRSVPAKTGGRRRAGGPRPRNQALVLEFLAAAGDQGVTVADVLEQGAARGTPLARASISSLLSRLKRQGRVSGDGGRYILVT